MKENNNQELKDMLTIKEIISDYKLTINQFNRWIKKKNIQSTKKDRKTQLYSKEILEFHGIKNLHNNLKFKSFLKTVNTPLKDDDSKLYSSEQRKEATFFIINTIKDDLSNANLSELDLSRLTGIGKYNLKQFFVKGWTVHLLHYLLRIGEELKPLEEFYYIRRYIKFIKERKIQTVSTENNK